MFHRFFQFSSNVLVPISVFAFLQLVCCLQCLCSYCFTFWEFLTSALADCLSLELEWQKFSPQVSRTLLNILADLNNTVVWIVSTRPLISKSSSYFTKPFVIVARVPTTNVITVTFMFHSFSIPLKYKYLDLFLFAFFQFYSVVSRESKVHSSASSIVLLLLFIIRCGCLAEIRWFVSQNPRGVCVCHSPGQMLGYAYTICSKWSNFNFLQNSLWITLPTRSCLVLYSLCANSFTMWLIVLSLSPHKVHLHLMYSYDIVLCCY